MIVLGYLKTNTLRHSKYRNSNFLNNKNSVKNKYKRFPSEKKEHLVLRVMFKKKCKVKIYLYVNNIKYIDCIVVELVKP